MTTFVLIPGACHGGWWFEPLARRLREHGHQAYSVTLTGLGDRAHLMTASVNLDTHIQDVISLLENEQIEDAVLVGHSYAGMVVTGAADRAADRIDALVYVDAFVPGDGDSAWYLTNDAQRRWYIDGASADGLGIAPMPFFDPRSTPHPLASAVQRLRLVDPMRKFRRRDYLYAAEFPESPFASTYERLRDDPDWHAHALKSGHNVMKDALEELLRILLETVPTS
ncbi:alpha/beta hydrolase [Streptacidiphilus sp. NEAU-YB345]|uniref:Alpha/beta hydrolase n=2 Tax=Streptacidiphilus fuscans TaxID=2789292 RepID=A0A931FIQ6_9ACTN|nr:alpha/beta hydrolase [Streptacidiphilus fuscans]